MFWGHRMEIYSLVKSTAVETLRFFNKPYVKESIKKTIAVSFCIFAVMELYDLIKDFYEGFKGKHICQLRIEENVSLSQKAFKSMLVISKVSILIAGIINPYGIRGVKFLFGYFSNLEWFSRLFGPNTNFVSNPLHPRHVLSIGNAILGVPATFKILYDTTIEIANKIFGNRACYEESKIGFSQNRMISNRRVQLITTWNTILSRPALHFYHFCFKRLLGF